MRKCVLATTVDPKPMFRICACAAERKSIRSRRSTVVAAPAAAIIGIDAVLL